MKHKREKKNVKQTNCLIYCLISNNNNNKNRYILYEFSTVIFSCYSVLVFLTAIEKTISDFVIGALKLCIINTIYFTYGKFSYI